MPVIMISLHCWELTVTLHTNIPWPARNGKHIYKRCIHLSFCTANWMFKFVI